MSTLKEVLGREAEQLNLRNVMTCVVLVICVVAVAFGLSQLRPLVESTSAGGASAVVATGMGAVH